MKPGQSSPSFSLYLYLCGSNLETRAGAAGKNISEILSVPLPEHVNIIIQTGGAKKWRSHGIPSDSLNRYKAEKGGLTLLKCLPNASMGSGETFTEFLTYCVREFPAEEMAVILWDHGGGSIGGIANDENFSFDSISLPELAGALETVSKAMHGRFGLFGFDACLMANLETAAVLEPYAKYMLASEEIEPGGGWDYRAILNAVSGDRLSTRDLGKAICDSYYKKCDAKGKGAMATISMTDLRRLPALIDAFDLLAGEMVQSATKSKGVQFIAGSAKTAQKFGGTTADEGFSNLVDLRHFAENSIDFTAAAQFVREIDRAVVYKANGSQKHQSGGLSFYYPFQPDDKKLDFYCRQICPSKNYITYLKTVYGHIPRDPIIFTDSGSMAADGSFQIQLADTSRNYILSVEYRLLEMSLGGEAGKPVLTGSWFGHDSDLHRNWESLRFHSNFRGTWKSLNGCKLSVTPVEYTEDYIIFTAPIILNGERRNLRFAFIRDRGHENGGCYKIIGAWNGIDPVTGMSDKGVSGLTASDHVKACYHYQTLEIGSNGLPQYSGIKERVQDVPGGGYEIAEEPLDAEDYQYSFVITDIFGGSHYSSTAWLHMTKTVEELRCHPLLRGEYAAVVDTVMGKIPEMP